MKDNNYSAYQKSIINNYYKNKEGMALQKLQEMVAELYLADSEKKLNSLWKRVDKALVNLEISEKLRNHIVSARDPEVLAKNIKDWF
jgi:hypothetical protein